MTLTEDRDQAAAVSDRIRLLADCRTAFGNAEALPTTLLIARLRSDPEAPWGDHGPGGINAMRLGSMLREYDIRSANIRFGEPIGRVKGYYRDGFTDAWDRYCPLPQGEPYQPYQPYREGITAAQTRDGNGWYRTARPHPQDRPRADLQRYDRYGWYGCPLLRRHRRGPRMTRIPSPLSPTSPPLLRLSLCLPSTFRATSPRRSTARSGG